ncbi:MAG: DsbC family protein [Smithellaceae bacterium]|nr:DsbC family protein [Smithellaceae bacterium]
MKKLLIAVAMIALLAPGCASSQKFSVEEQFKKSFPKNTYETFTETPMKGVYEVYNGKQVYYYLPENDVLLLGNIVTKDGKNLTQESNSKKMAAKMAALPLDKALKIGNGKTAVVEFIDPNCHYCKLSFDFFNKRKKEVTLYIFFFPLSEDSEKKIRHILCSKNMEQSFNDVLGGKVDGNSRLNLCGDKNVEDRLRAHFHAASKIGVRGTPLLYIKGRIVPGFDQPVIEKLLTE